MSNRRQFFEDLTFLALNDPPSLQELMDEYLRIASFPTRTELPGLQLLIAQSDHPSPQQFGEPDACTFVVTFNGIQLKARLRDNLWRIIQ